MQTSPELQNRRVSRRAGPAQPATESTRYGGLDALRALAVMGGVLLHACVAYMPSRMPDLLWPVHDAHPTVVCHLIFWWLHCLRLPVFFVISGFFAEMMCQSRGADVFLKNRIQRIAIPYHILLVTLMPLTLAIWIGGLWLNDRVTLEAFFSFSKPVAAEIRNHFFGPGHLWFLADLTIISVTFGLIRREFPARPDAPPAALFRLRWPALAPVYLAGPSLMLLWGNTSPFVVHNNTFVPDTARLAYYGLYFFAGVVAFRRKEQAFELLKYPFTHLSLSLVAVIAMFATLPDALAGRATLLNRLFLSASVALVAWLSVFGLMAIFLNQWKSDRPAFRYLADASYWVYIIHLPLVGMSHIALQQAPIGAFTKFLLTALITLSVAVMSYQTCVRYTFIGRALNGPRTRKGEAAREPAVARHADHPVAIELPAPDDALVPAIVHAEMPTSRSDRKAA
jgi:peptidoglycan/LPS O-acetylase OafA/YrhL